MIILGGMLIVAGVVLFFTESMPYMRSIHYQIHRITRPYDFDYVSWELQALSSLPDVLLSVDAEVKPTVKLSNEMGTVLKDNGIGTFPPVLIEIGKPPSLLVISPRDRIAYADRFLLSQHLEVKEKERIEAKVDSLGVSSLVVELGGFGAVCPPIVSDNLSLTNTVNIAVEEWFHQYLAFRPLGFRYFLDSIGLQQDPELIVLNETFVGMVSREIGAEIIERYYKGVEYKAPANNSQGFSFYDEMSETRKIVDYYLEQGKIVEAEYYMEKRRMYFIEHGYYIRKLNQAYFAFHGIYGESPASVSPIYHDLQQLRAASPTLNYFVSRVENMTSYAELLKVLEEQTHAS
jgi:hypothetical protein